MDPTVRHLCVRALTWMFACGLAVSPSRAAAQPAAALSSARQPGEPRPWATGVSDAEQATALALYEAGNREFTESRFAQALTRYKEAIQHWDHPAIRFNMAVCLINLGQPLEAKDNLERSLAYGERPLGADAYGQGITYRKLLDAQLGRITIACRDPGTQVTLDGKLLLAGPAQVSELLLPGEHQVVATKPGFLTASWTLVLVAGKLTTYDVRPLELAGATREVRRWAAWKPWAVVAGGGVLAGLGALSNFAASSNFAAYDHGIALRCPTGCDAATLAGLTELRGKQDRATVEQDVAFGLFAAGGAAVLAGVIGLIANQPRMQREPTHPQPIVTPTAGGAAVSLTWGF